MTDVNDGAANTEGVTDERSTANGNGASKFSRYWSMFFWAAAVFNLIFGLAAMLSPDATIDARMIGLLVFSFGIVYFHVARDPMRFGPVIWAGVLCKIGVVALLAPQILGGTVQPMLAAGLVVEGLFALGFLIFVLSVLDEYEI